MTMKKKLITVLTVIGDAFKANKGLVSEFIILMLVTLIFGLVFGNALAGACIGAIAHAGLGKVLDLLGLAFSTNSRTAVVGISVGTLLVLVII